MFAPPSHSVQFHYLLEDFTCLEPWLFSAFLINSGSDFANKNATKSLFRSNFCKFLLCLEHLLFYLFREFLAFCVRFFYFWNNIRIIFMLVIFLMNMLKITSIDVHTQFARHCLKIVAIGSHESFDCNRDHRFFVYFFNMQPPFIFLFLSEYFALLL